MQMMARVLRDLYDEHRVLLAVTLLYIVAGGAVQSALGRPWPLQFTTRWFTTLWVWGSTVWLIGHVAARHRGQRARLSADQFLGAVLLAGLAVPLQITFQSLKQSIGVARGFPWDPLLARLDSLLHFGPAWHWYAFLFDHLTLLKSIDMLYLLWFVSLVITLVWLCWTHLRALRQRALLAMLLLWIGAGTLGAWTLASAGPCFRTDVDPDAAALIVRLDSSRAALIARGNQQNVWAAYEQDRWLPFGGVSAMPSVHVGFAVLMAIILWQRDRRLGLLLWLYAGVMQVGSVILGWHYGIDGYAGALFAWGAWRSAGFLCAISPVEWRAQLAPVQIRRDAAIPSQL